MCPVDATCGNGTPCRERENAFILAMISGFNPPPPGVLIEVAKCGDAPGPRRAALIWAMDPDGADMPTLPAWDGKDGVDA